MGTKLEIFFGKFAIYIVAVLMFVCIALSAGWYVSNLRLQGQTYKANAIAQQLQVSNASYNSIKNQFGLLTAKLEDNQRKGLESHARTQQQLAAILEADKTKQNVETYLLNRATTTDCKMPKDLLDAWSKM